MPVKTTSRTLHLSEPSLKLLELEISGASGFALTISVLLTARLLRVFWYNFDHSLTRSFSPTSGAPSLSLCMSLAASLKTLIHLVFMTFWVLLDFCTSFRAVFLVLSVEIVLLNVIILPPLSSTDFFFFFLLPSSFFGFSASLIPYDSGSLGHHPSGPPSQFPFPDGLQ
jgi:hypothetical protein